MFTYTCPNPKCRKRLTSKKAPNGAVEQCVKCHERMRVIFDESAQPDTASEERSGKALGPLLVGGSALVGCLIGGVILLAASLNKGKTPQNVPTRDEVVQANGPTRSPTDGGSHGDSSPKANSELRTDPGVKPDTQVKADSDRKPDTGLMSSDELYNEMLKSCVWILATDGKESWSGSGSLIDREERLVLTNQHVANRRCTKIWVFFPIYRDSKLVTESESYLADFKKDRPENAIAASFVSDQAICDLALIRLSRLPKGVKPLRLSKRTIRPGQALHTVGGKPKGNTAVWIYSSGSVRQVSVKRWTYGDGFKREAEVIASSVSTNPGDSGGAVVDSRGILVGVHAMSADGVLNAGHIHVNEVRRFLQTAYRQMEKQFIEAPDEGAGAISTEKIVELMKGLEAPDLESRKKAVNALGKIGPDAQKAVIALLRIVRNKNEVGAVRRAAVSALKEIGAPEHEQLNKLLAALNDTECEDARRYAAESLASFPEDKRKEVVEALKKALKDKDAKVRQKAAAALGSYGKFAYDEANAELVERLRDPEPGVRDAAYHALLAGGVPDEADKAVAEGLLQGEKDGGIMSTPEARYWAAFLFVHVFKEAGLPYLLQAFDKEENFKDINFVTYVVKWLREFKINSPVVGAILSQALDHREDSVQMEAIRTLVTLEFGENTVEAYLKVFKRGPKLLAKLERETGQKNAGDLEKKTRADFTTFTKKAGLGFKVTPDLLKVLIEAVKEPNGLARQVAVNCLECIGKDAAKAAPALGAALLEEKSDGVRIEILAALAALGKAGGDELGDNARVQEELDRWIGDARADQHIVRVLAALAKASLYPDQKQSSKAYRVLARALLLENADIKFDQVQMTRFGIRTMPVARPEPNAREKELHERAKQALSIGGATAGDAICTVFESSFWPAATDKLDVMLDKIHARITAFQVLAKIGPPLKVLMVKGTSFNPVAKLIQKALTNEKRNLEDSRVTAAAREAQVEIFRK
jgi:HEAT repeat protein